MQKGKDNSRQNIDDSDSPPVIANSEFVKELLQLNDIIDLDNNFEDFISLYHDIQKGLYPSSD